jgi:dihydrofolate synthase/folylpolyglutamate synthase
VSEYAQEINAQCLQNGIDFKVENDTWSNTQGLLIELPKTNLPSMNMAAVVQAVNCITFDIKPCDITLGLAKARLIGRFQRLQWQGKQVILDVAHNPHAAKNLAATLALEASEGKAIAVLAMLGDKDYKQVITTLKDSFDVWMLATSEGVRGLSSQVLAEQVTSNGVNANQVAVFNTPLEAFSEALKVAAPNDTIIVFGSFVTVGEILTLTQPK